MEEQLRSMQRQLAALCALPAALQKSLTAVSERIYRLLPPELEPEVNSFETLTLFMKKTSLTNIKHTA